MDEIVNRTFKGAAEWHRHIVRIRINVACIRAELPHLEASGHDVSGIQALLGSFDSTFEQFCRNELEVFVAARLSETEDKEKNALIGHMRRIRESFSSWLHQYHEVVEAKKASDSQGPLSLLLCFGIELLNAHSRFVNVIDGYIDEMELQQGGYDIDSGPIVEAKISRCYCDKLAGMIRQLYSEDYDSLTSQRCKNTSSMASAALPLMSTKRARFSVLNPFGLSRQSR